MMCATWPLNICLLLLRILTCEHYTIALQQHTSKQVSCYYIVYKINTSVFKINTLPCNLLLVTHCLFLKYYSCTYG